jgi:Alpha-acetolactate decarboxylase
MGWHSIEAIVTLCGIPASESYRLLKWQCLHRVPADHDPQGGEGGSPFGWKITASSPHCAAQVPKVNVMKMINNNTERRDLQLNCMLSVGLWVLLQDHCRKTNEPVSHFVSLALADYFQVSHSTLYQVSTATALVEGIYQGAVRVRTLREHGDLGLGTFENLDGEMVVVDGHFFQARSDGSVTEVDDDVHIILIDGSYDMVAEREILKYDRPSGTDFGPVDPVKYAEAFGAKGTHDPITRSNSLCVETSIRYSGSSSGRSSGRRSRQSQDV